MSGRLTAFFVTLLTAFGASAQFTDVINSNRPGESMAAFSVGKTVFQTELGTYMEIAEHEGLQTESRGLGFELDIRYGAFLEQLEFIGEFKYHRDHYETPLDDYTRDGVRQVTLGAKYLFYDPDKNYVKKPNLYSWKANHKFNWREFIPAVGFYAGFNLNYFNNPYKFDNDENFSPKAMIITQNQFGKWVFVTNLIADKIAANNMSLGYIVTLTRGFNYRWSGFIENQGVKSDLYSDSVLRGGAAFLIKENIQVDASVGTNFKDTPNILTAGVGVSWRFDQNYEEVLLRAPKTEKEIREGKKEKKDKKDKKKRRDEVVPEVTPEP